MGLLRLARGPRSGLSASISAGDACLVVCRGARRERGVVIGVDRRSVGKRDAQPFERDDDVAGPWPALLEPDDGLAAGVRDRRGGVEHAVPEPFGFGTASAPVKHSCWDRAMRSWAMRTSCSQASLHTTSTHGGLRSPVSLAARMRFST